MGDLFNAALRMDVEDAKRSIRDGAKPRNVFERVIFQEARDQMRRVEGRRS